MSTQTGKLLLFLGAAWPALLPGFSTGPPIFRAGIPADGGLTCVVCHKTFVTADSDPRGRITITAAPYVPGVKQTISINIIHPDQKRWGFQMSARLASDPSKQAGTFTAGQFTRVRCAPAGADAPCNGATEFVEHGSAQVTDVGAGFTYTVDWTPPANATEDVIFYAAGNAANGDGTLNGDRIYTTNAVVSPAICNMSTLPVISSALSAASYGGTISPGSFVALFGSGFQPSGQSRSIYPGDLATGGVFPSKLSCVAVEIDGRRAPIAYVNDKQINLQVPSSTSSSNPVVRVIVNPGASNPIVSPPLNAVGNAYSPALFTLDGTHAVAQFSGTANLVSDPSVIASGKPANPGDLVTLYATGLGDTSPHVDAGLVAPGVARVVTTPAITIGGVALAPADIQYIGLVPTAISALYQLNLRLPATTPGGNPAVKLTVGGVSSPDGVTIRVAP